MSKNKEELDKYAKIQRNMERFGGAFASHLAVLMVKADAMNLYKIVITWPELMKEYSDEKWDKLIEDA